MRNLTATREFNISTMLERIDFDIQSVLTEILTTPTIITFFGFPDDGNRFTARQIIGVNSICILVCIWLVWTLWKILFFPTDVYHDVTDIGFVHHDKRIPRQDAIRAARKNRKIGDVPPVYPNGWFRLLDSDMIKKEEVKSVQALGEHFAVFRNSEGKIRILDAYCPHLGANMASGGRVIDKDCLQCPFHGWKFSGEDGSCVEIPYAKKVPKRSSVQRWPAREVNGVIYVWYHCDRTEPSWQLHEIPNLSQLKYVGRTEHLVNSHIQDIPENAADFAHLGFLHKPVVGHDVEKTYGAMYTILQHSIEASWKPSEDPNHPELAMMQIKDSTHIHLFGFKIPVKELHFYVEQIGPGNVHIHVNASFFHGVLIQTITPAEPMLQRLSHSLYVARSVPMCLGKLFLYLESTQIERDIMVWNNKTYRRSPIFVQEESSLARHRRWFRQFYSENSPRLNPTRTRVIDPRKIELNDW